ncbi:nucleotide sugar dehydrogenase [Candidatus Pelagibacter bacterium nBUS_29]|uniref:nucleotide sugar dehydrogenase n=1 Tax=Candidatus Pelagibacter bacterium nBUS_29 TaxID=3374190 RepID=UPI003EBD06EC
MTIAIIGAGYVGLPLAIAFANHHSVVCYDINKSRINELKKGIDTNKQHLKKELIKNRLTFTCRHDKIENKDIYIITVPTPINNLNQPDLSMLKHVSLLVGKVMRQNSIIIFESTTYPGCTEEFCIPLIEKTSKLKYKRDFDVAYSPERVNPGDEINTLKSITKIVGANNLKTLKKIKKFYNSICKSIYTVNSIKIAESAKVIENIQRDVNIALVNELGVLFNKLDIPTNEVLKAASTKWNFHYYKPGLVGGHCISVDPYYLAYKAKQKNYLPKLILSGRKINESMGKYVAKQTIKLLSINKKKLSNSNVAILGFSFKDNIPDTRNTKVIQIVNHLQKQKIKVKLFDTIASRHEIKKKYKVDLYNFSNLKKFKYDAIILAVSHKEFLKNLNYYDKFYKSKQNKIFIDVKNNYSSYNLNKNNYKFFQL